MTTGTGTENDGTASGDKPETVPKSQFDAEVAKRAALEKDVAAMADAVLATIPDNLRALIPDALTPAQRVAWFTRAKATGVFGDAKATVPTTDTGRPKTSPKDEDLSKLPPVARIARGYAAQK
jgi:hypothetical protein